MAKWKIFAVWLSVCMSLCAAPIVLAQPPEDVPNRGRGFWPWRRTGPLAVQPEAGEFPATLVSPARYISPWAALFSPNVQPSTSEELQAYYQSNERSQLLSVPEMFGDFRRGGPVLHITPLTAALPTLQTEAPHAAAISGLRIAENNQALPADRVWVAYNYFANAFDVRTSPSFGLPPTNGSQSLHRTVVALEYLLDPGRTSVEIRMPFGSAFRFAGVTGFGVGGTPFFVEGKSFGNLNLILKRLLYADDARALSVGVGVELPTGSVGEVTYDAVRTRLEPEAVHLVPFLAWTQRCGCWFGHLFVQLDAATHGDSLQSTLNIAGTFAPAGRIDPPVALGIDAGVGYWLLPLDEYGTGLAVVGEVHYTTPLAGDDQFTTAGALTTISVNTPVASSQELLHFTGGLQMSFSHDWSLRTGVVLPARTERVFDTEYFLQINRTY